MKKWVLFLSFIFVFSFVLSSVSAWDSGWVDVATVTRCCEAGCGGGQVCQWAGNFCTSTGYNLNWIQLSNSCAGAGYKFLCQGGYCNLLKGMGLGKTVNIPASGNYYVSVEARRAGANLPLYLGTGTSWGNDNNRVNVAYISGDNSNSLVSCAFGNTFSFSSTQASIWVETLSTVGSYQVKSIRISDSLPSGVGKYCENGNNIPQCIPGNEVCNQVDDDCDSQIDENACTSGQPCSGNNQCQPNLVCDSTNHCTTPVVVVNNPPTISSVNWANNAGQLVTSIYLDGGVFMNISGNNLTNQNINYTIYFNGILNSSIVSQTIGLDWTPQSVGNYTFTARVVLNGASGSSRNLSVTVNPLPNIPSSCDIGGLSWYDNSTGKHINTTTGQDVFLGFCGGQDRAPGGTLDCCPSGYECKGSLGCQLNSTLNAGSNNLTCNYYNLSNTCNADVLNLRFNEYQYGVQGCGTTISNGSAQYNISCFCNWDVNKCKFGKNVTTPNGGNGPGNYVVSSCLYDTVLGQCVNGQQTATTIGKLVSGNDPSSCKNETLTIPCGRNVLQLPFFGIWQFTLSLVGIALIYALFGRRLIYR